MSLLTLYRGLLYLYPSGYRREYGEEMSAVFREVEQDAADHGYAPCAAFCAREILGLLSGALREHLGGATPSWIPFRRFAMRPEFRFPRSTIFMMLALLAAVVLAIAEAESVQAKYSHATGSAWLPMVSILGYMLVVMCAAAVVWAILFALRRSGAHRLANLQAGDERSPVAACER